jgi:hypothetical protein
MKKLSLELEELQVESFDTTPGARPRRGTVFGNETLNQNGCGTNWGVCYGDTGLVLVCSMDCPPMTYEMVSCLRTDCEPSCFEACGPAPTGQCATGNCATQRGQNTCYTACPQDPL